jgi:hypothetical protein
MFGRYLKDCSWSCQTHNWYVEFLGDRPNTHLLETHFAVQTLALWAGLCANREFSRTSLFNTPREKHLANAQAMIAEINGQVVEVVAGATVESEEPLSALVSSTTEMISDLLPFTQCLLRIEVRAITV